MKIALWIHCLTQIILPAALNFYFYQLHRHILFLDRGNFRHSEITAYAIQGRILLWLIPITFVASAFALQRRAMTPDRYAIFSACSIFVLAALLGIAVLATCALFWASSLTR